MKRILLICAFVLATATVCAAQNTIYFPHIVDGNLGGTTIWKTTIFLTNPAAANTAAANVTVTFTKDTSTTSGSGSPFTIAWVDQNGKAVPSSGNTISFQLAGQQTQILVSTAAGTYAGGFATVASSQPVSGTAIFSEFNSAGTLIGEAGVPAASAAPSQSIFVDTVGGYNIGVAFANPSTTASANVKLSLTDTTGAVVATSTQVLGPGNHKAAFTSELFPSVTTQLGGTMLISTDATTPLVAIALRFDPSFSVFTTLPPVIPTTVSSSTQNTIYFPHVVDGNLGGSTIWKTTIFLTNPAATGTAATNVTVTLTKDNSTLSGSGSPFTITWVDESGKAVASSGNTITFPLAGQQTKVLVSTAAGSYAGGFATVSSSQPVSGTAIFSEFNGSGKLIGEAGVPAATAVASQSIFVDTVNGYAIGVAFANPNSSAANVTLNLVSTSGATVASTSQVLGPGNHKAAFTSELFPAFTAALGGTMQITTDASTPLVAIALRFDPSFSIFTTLPPVPIAPPPIPLTITSVSPGSVARGGTLTITGTGFSSTAANNTVLFLTASGGTVSATATSATATSLTVVVPATAVSGPVQVQSAGQTTSSTTSIIDVTASSTGSSPSLIQSTIPVSAGQTISGQDIYVPAVTTGALNATTVGIADVGASSVLFGSSSVEVPHGSTKLLLVAGTGISQANGTTLSISGPGVTVSGQPTFNALSDGTLYILVTITIDPTAALGPRDVILTNSNLQTSVVTGGLFIR